MSVTEHIMRQKTAEMTAESEREAVVCTECPCLKNNNNCQDNRLTNTKHTTHF